MSIFKRVSLGFFKRPGSDKVYWLSTSDDKLQAVEAKYLPLKGEWTAASTVYIEVERGIHIEHIADENGKPIAKAPATFAPGDVVMLRSGGYKMTVMRAGDDVRVMWMDESGALLSDDVPIVCLERSE